MQFLGKTLPLGAALAPMAGFTDASFRLLCRQMGAEITVTEMVSAAALHYRDRKTARLARLSKGEALAGVQLFGHDPGQMEEAAGLIASGQYEGCATEEPPAFIDINMGCPVKKIVTAGDGSALMKDPRLAGELVAAARRGASPYGVPVTVKIRAGWDESRKNAEEVAARAVENGAAAVTVHGRTREQMYEGRADWSVIAGVRRVLPAAVAVFGNGDVRTAEDFFRMKEETGCDGVAVGRAALSDPWLFLAVSSACRGETFVRPTEEERRREAFRLAEAVVAAEGPGAIRECRGRVGWFLRGLRGGAALRAAVNRAETLQQLQTILLSEENA